MAPVLRGCRVSTTQLSSLERDLNELRELQVLLTALVDDLVEEVPSVSPYSHDTADGFSPPVMRNVI